ncbi:MAG: T9SS type A sorting domain-containing protein [Flavobacteriales bacterium]|nr:T9SS type A sorting domain-containing protein [Flavobacteriales bacterium]
MRKTLLLLTLFANCVQGQSWCAPGAEWLFNFYSLQANGVRRAWYSGDTVVGGLPCQRINQLVQACEPIFPFGTPFSFQDMPIITHGQGDLIELWDEASQTFDTLAWYGAAPGDHWDVPHFPAPARFDVLDTGTAVVAGLPLRYVVVEEPVVMGVVDTLWERIGFGYYYLRPMETLLVDFTTTGMVCYTDDSLGQIDGRYPWHPCDFTLAVNENEALNVGAFPNPGTDQFTLSLPNGAHAIELFDAAGRCVLVQRTNELRPMVDTRQLAPGLFLVSVRNGDGERSVVRWVKE